MSRTQVRPKSGGDAYSPQRDLAYCYAPAMKEAMRSLDAANWTVEIRALIQALGVTEQAISIAVEALTNAHVAFITDSSVRHADDALRSAGWYNQPVEVRYLIYGRLGEVMLGGFFLAIRDVRVLGEEPPHARVIADYVAEGLRVAEQLGRTGVGATTDEDAPPTLVEVQLERRALVVQLQFARRALEESKLLLKRAGQLAKVGSAALHSAAKIADCLQTQLDYIDSLGLWRGICRAVVTWWQGGLKKTPSADKKAETN